MNYLVGAVSFSVQNSRIDYITNDFKDLVSRTYKTTEPLFINKFSFKGSDGELYETSAQLCVRKSGDESWGFESWAISYGYHEGVSFLYVKQIGPDDEPPRLSALLEEMPFMRPKWSQQQVELRYTTGETDPSDPTEAHAHGGKYRR